MDNTSQEENTLLDLIWEEVDRRGWNQAQLVKASGIPQPVASRLLNRNKIMQNIKVGNMGQVLNALDLLSQEPCQCPVKCGPEMQGWCRKVMLVIESGTNWAEILKLAIESCATSVMAERKITNAEKTLSSGHNSDTQKEPVKSIGSNEKAG